MYKKVENIIQSSKEIHISHSARQNHHHRIVADASLAHMPKRQASFSQSAKTRVAIFCLAGPMTCWYSHGTVYNVEVPGDLPAGCVVVQSHLANKGKDAKIAQVVRPERRQGASGGK